ncbi:MAG: hypothetical protein SFU87_13175 [Chitinophagaceae bacterium]|nr:hypothetical protein [Chitinophagaceae bacterium]
MHTKKSKSPGHILIFFLMTICFTFFSVVDAHAQKKGEKSEKHIVLKNDARSNGYKITVQNGESFFEAVNVTDPETKKLIEGTQRIFYRCSQNVPGIEVEVTFINGTSNRFRIDCIQFEAPPVVNLRF